MMDTKSNETRTTEGLETRGDAPLLRKLVALLLAPCFLVTSCAQVAGAGLLQQAGKAAEASGDGQTFVQKPLDEETIAERLKKANIQETVENEVQSTGLNVDDETLDMLQKTDPPRYEATVALKSIDEAIRNPIHNRVTGYEFAAVSSYFRTATSFTTKFIDTGNGTQRLFVTFAYSNSDIALFGATSGFSGHDYPGRPLAKPPGIFENEPLPKELFDVKRVQYERNFGVSMNQQPPIVHNVYHFEFLGLFPNSYGVVQTYDYLQKQGELVARINDYYAAQAHVVLAESSLFMLTWMRSVGRLAAIAGTALFGYKMGIGEEEVNGRNLFVLALASALHVNWAGGVMMSRVAAPVSTMGRVGLRASQVATHPITVNGLRLGLLTEVALLSMDAKAWYDAKVPFFSALCLFSAGLFALQLFNLRSTRPMRGINVTEDQAATTLGIKGYRSIALHDRMWEAEQAFIKKAEALRLKIKPGTAPTAAQTEEALAMASAFYKLKDAIKKATEAAAAASKGDNGTTSTAPQLTGPKAVAGGTDSGSFQPSSSVSGAMQEVWGDAQIIYPPNAAASPNVYPILRGMPADGKVPPGPHAPEPQSAPQSPAEPVRN